MEEMFNMRVLRRRNDDGEERHDEQLVFAYVERRVVTHTDICKRKCDQTSLAMFRTNISQ